MIAINILRFLLTSFLVVLIPMYWRSYGIQNFLWLSDIGLFLTFLGVWFKSPLLISMAIIGIMPVEIVWFIDFILHLARLPNLSITDYMFDSQYTRFLRALSFFHVIVPLIWVWLIKQWGYDDRAFWYQSGLMAIVFLLSYFFTDPEKNINWVYTAKVMEWNWMPSFVWVILVMASAILCVVLPMHFLLKSLE